MWEHPTYIERLTLEIGPRLLSKCGKVPRSLLQEQWSEGPEHVSGTEAIR